MGAETIRVDRQGAVAILTLDRPDRLNACSTVMADEIVAALADLGDARAVLLRGEGRAFCAGADLQAAGGTHATPGEGAHAALVEHFNLMILALARLDRPIVCAVAGPAAGIGSSMALACDFVVAGASAYFLQAFVNIGLIPDGGASWLLPRLVGTARAAEMMMLGEKLPAAKAAEWGLIHRCVADDVLADEAMALATRLAAMPTKALGIMRGNLHAGLSGTLGETLEREAVGQRAAADSRDAAIGMAAFLTKQEAQFTGT